VNSFQKILEYFLFLWHENYFFNILEEEKLLAERIEKFMLMFEKMVVSFTSISFHPSEVEINGQKQQFPLLFSLTFQLTSLFYSILDLSSRTYFNLHN
jgi:hypothetical protein